MTKSQEVSGRNHAGEKCLLLSSCLGLLQRLMDCGRPVCVACFKDFAADEITMDVFLH